MVNVNYIIVSLKVEKDLNYAESCPICIYFNTHISTAILTTVEIMYQQFILSCLLGPYILLLVLLKGYTSIFSLNSFEEVAKMLNIFRMCIFQLTVTYLFLSYECYYFQSMQQISKALVTFIIRKPIIPLDIVYLCADKNVINVRLLEHNLYTF